jgi:3-hydroxyacyl-CoA dehydrogenase/enoyl-CoA hydratase/3-hydroxybutyryl-CoA epimerase
METIKLIDHDGFIELCFDLPDSPVNTLAARVLEEVEDAMDELAARPDLRGLLITSAKRNVFIAGADIHDIEAIHDALDGARLAARGQAIINRIADLPAVTVAAIDGASLGGGCELALACDWRVASDNPKAKIGLPEVQLGIVPGFGGCYRLPRVVGLEQGLAMILGAKTLQGKRALKAGLIDALIPQAIFRQEAERFIRDKIDGTGKRRPRRKRGMRALLLEDVTFGRKFAFAQARKGVMAKTRGHYPSILRAVAVIEEGWGKQRNRALDIEARALGEMAVTSECGALVSLYFAGEQLKKESGVPGSVGDPPAVKAAAVLGAGVMGGGIAQLVADREIPVRMKDIKAELVSAGMQAAHKVWSGALARHRLTPHDYRRRATYLAPTIAYDGFRRVDLVAEAVSERMDVKRKVLIEAETQLRDDAVFASNTSSLPITEIAAQAIHPERVIGLHFFNPVHRMPLVEVIRGEKTSDRATLTTVAFAKKLGKTPVVVADRPGFLVNRLLLPYLNEAALILEEGSDIAQLDKLVLDFGMPMGPFTLMDTVGLDICKEVTEVLYGAFGERMKPSRILDVMVSEGRLGDKVKRGFYQGKGKKRGVDPTVYRELGVPQTDVANPETALDRMVLAMVNEGARCLEEAVVASPVHLDMAMVMGTGFPPFRGGLMHYADSRSIEEVVRTLHVLADRHGPRFQPAPLLVRMAEKAESFF